MHATLCKEMKAPTGHLENPGIRSGNKLLGLVIILPFLFLLAFLFDLRFPVPRILLPERKYLLTYPIPEEFSGFAVLEESVVQLGKDKELNSINTRNFPPHPSIELALLDSSLHQYSAATMLVDGAISSRQAELAAGHYRETGIPVKFIRMSGKYKGFVSASSAEYDSRTSSIRVSILLEPSCLEAGSISATINGLRAYQGSGKTLPQDRRLSFAVPSDITETIIVLDADFPETGGKQEVTLRFSAQASGQPGTLIVSQKQNMRSVIEAFYPSSRIQPKNLDGENLFLYELIVLDGIRLEDLSKTVSAKLVDYVRRGAGSLFFVADSENFAKTGDSPAIESILPVALYPRSQKKLPDMSLLLLIDTSGSMFGDKLSLAKVTGAETLSNMKPDDMVGVLLFSEGFSWLYGFTRKSGIEIIPNLEPVRAGGGTRLFQALAEGIEKIKDTPMPVKHIVLISDGVTEPADFEGAIAEAADNKITISVMAIGDNYNDELLSGIAAGTGGNFYHVLSAKEIPSLLLEDRENISRTVFSTDQEKIVTLYGTDSGSVSGMARFTPKGKSIVLFSTISGDPLLASLEITARSVFLFSSDIYAGYTKKFFDNKAALAIFKTVLDKQFREQTPSFIVTQTREQATIIVHGDYLVKPSLAVANGSGRIIQDTPMVKIMPSWYSTTTTPEFDAPYTAILSDRGGTLARFPFFSNGNMEAITDTSMRANDGYSSPIFALLPGQKIWLVLFFIFSLGLTVLKRIMR